MKTGIAAFVTFAAEFVQAYPAVIRALLHC
jgi:hypothetical protein